MLTVVLAAAILSGSAFDGPVQQATPLPPVTVTQRAEAEPAPEATTRRVCRFETVTGSNRRTRVCRDVPRQGVQDQQTREFMRDSQRVRLPDGG